MSRSRHGREGLTLTIIDKPRVLRDYLVYDMEWVPGKFSTDGTMDVRMVGVYDGTKYRTYRTVDQFLLGELTSRNRGKWFYAHAGGLADFQFVLEKLITKHGYRIKAATSGSSLIIVHVSKGKHSWHFIDSLWLLKDKLRNIGKWIGIHKGNEDESEEFYRDASFAVLREYNEQDCIILYRAISMFEDTLLSLGGQLKMTQASCAMELFRRRYLQRDIVTSPMVNDISRKAYFASRVEVLNRHCYNAWYYDINSSFPYAMTFPIPGDMIAHHRGRMPFHFDNPFVADVEIEVPEISIPPIPTRLDGRLFFPTGKWRSWLSSIDIELLEWTGGKVLKCYESVVFEPRTDCKDFAEDLYAIRAKSEGFMKISVKFILNSLYGKFAESDLKSSIEINPEHPKGQSEGWEMLFPGCFIVERKVPIPHMHVPISAHITAIARRNLYQFMTYSGDVHYCDTDGFSSSEMLQSTDGVLGAIKLEKTIDEGFFRTQKVYRLEGKDDKGHDLNTPPADDPKGVPRGVKAKGFSRMSVEKFQKIIEGEEITYTRMARTKELLRRHQTTPVEKAFRKRLRDDLIPKRFFYPDGYSRPWDIDEIKTVMD